jgi:serine/threonine-protein kinase
LIRKRRADGQPPLSLKKLVRLLTPVARALERAHNFHGPDGPVSIVHRDLKPENIFVANVAGEEVVKILDFGIGKAKSMISQVAGRASETGGGIATFTPAYGSPEQWAPKRYGQTGAWTDVWGLALTLSEAMVGRPVIDGDPAAIMGTVLDPHRRPTPGSEGVIVSDDVERVFAKALALDPRFRYADAGVFWNALLAAARITSGELQEVRLPRDARAEPGGGVRVERVDVARRAGAGRSPSGAAPASVRGGAQQRVLDAPLAGGAAPALRPLSTEPPAAAFPPAVTGSFEVPDLDLAPVSRPAVPRTASGMRAAVAPPRDLDEITGDFGEGASLDLDLPSGDPLVSRVSSYPRPPERSVSPPPVTVSVSASPPPVARPASVPPAASVPPVSRAPVIATPPKPEFQLQLAAPPHATLLERLLPGGLVLAGAILVTILDQVYSAVSGEVFTLGPFRSSMIAGFAMVVGVVLCVYRLKRD